MVASALFTFVAVLRLSRVRYLALTIPPFVTGYLGSPHSETGYLWVGMSAIVLLRAISSIGNCVTDRVEDAADHPQRVILCERVGYGRLSRLISFLTIAYLLLVTSMAVVLDVYLGALLLWLAYLLIKLSYSFGPRLKPKRFSATVLLGGVSGGMLFVGWIGDGLDGAGTAIAGGILLWAMGSSLSGSKDAPNLEGDHAIGYRSVYRDLVESSRPLKRAVAVVSQPYAVAILLALLTMQTGGPGLRLLWCLAVYPGAIAFTVVLVRAQTAAGRSLVRELGYLYWIVFMDVVLISLVPEPATVAVTSAGLCWYLLTSRLAHPDPTPYSWHDLRTVRALISGT